MAAVAGNGKTQLQIAGKLKTGQYFYGSDTVSIKGQPQIQNSRAGFKPARKR